MSIATDTFGYELQLIENEAIRNFTIHVLESAPPYFWMVPSSSTGKYHSRQSNGTGGLVRHSRGVVYFAIILCRAYSVEGKDRDIVYSACLLHDLLKYGLVMKPHTTKTHDKEAADFIHGLWKNNDFGICQEDIIKLCSAVAFHFGQWTSHPKAKKFPEEYTLLETIVHLADMCSAGKEVSLDFLNDFGLGA